MGDDVFNKGVVYHSTRPTAVANEEWKGMRTNQYGEQYIQSQGDWRYSRLREASYFIAHNPTIDAATTLAGHPASVVADADVTLTKPLVAMVMPTGSSVYAELDYISITTVVAAAAGTTAEWTAQLDNGRAITTAGTSFTRISPNMQSSAVPTLLVTGGPIVVGAETANCRVLGNDVLRMAIEFAGDRTTFKFGGDPTVGSNVVAGAASRHIVALPPVILGSGDGFYLALYAAASQTNAGIYRISMGWSER